MGSQAMADAIALALALFGFHAPPSTATQAARRAARCVLLAPVACLSYLDQRLAGCWRGLL